MNASRFHFSHSSPSRTPKMLTDRQIQAAIRAATTETVLNDGAQIKGGGSLKLRIRIGGEGATAAWLAAWKMNGKRASKSLGNYPIVSLMDARERFTSEVQKPLLTGKDPNAIIALVDNPTIERLFQAYIESLKGKNAATWRESERLLLTGSYNAADDFGRNTIASLIEPGDIANLLAKGIKRGSRRTTDMQRTAMAAAFNWAMKSTHDYTQENRTDWGIKYNPVAAVPRDQSANKTIERNLSAEEMKHVWQNAPDQTGDVMRLVMCTGQRVIEVMRIAGADVDLKAALWTMPATKTKGRRHSHMIPLTSQAVSILSQLMAINGDGYLFPARTGATGEIIGIPSVSRGASRIAGIKRFTPRDLRRTWKSRAGDAGIDRFMRDIIQQHAQTDTGSKHYDRFDYLPQMREAMKKWETWLQNAIQ